MQIKLFKAWTFDATISRLYSAKLTNKNVLSDELCFYNLVELFVLLQNKNL